MALFICEECGCIENTALTGFRWDRAKKRRILLCSECDPDIGKWHDKFSKKKWDGKLEVINPPKD